MYILPKFVNNIRCIELFQELDTYLKNVLDETVKTKVILNLLYINITSIQKHYNQIQVYLTYRLDCLDVLILSERIQTNVTIG